MARRNRARFSNLRHDLIAGSVLGIESVPDGLATGLLAGVNPLAGVYGYMVGTAAGALATSSAFMAVQGTGAMAILIADVSAVHDAANPARALFTLAMLTGVVMVAAGLLKLGTVLRFVSNAVMVGFINAVGVNIVLGQLANLTGYSSPHGSRLTRALDTLLHPGRLHWTIRGRSAWPPSCSSSCSNEPRSVLSGWWWRSWSPRRRRRGWGGTWLPCTTWAPPWARCPAPSFPT